MKTRINHVSDDWKRVKNHCRTTVNKAFSEKDATPEFKKKLLISEHTPIRQIIFDWSWLKIPYWVAMEWARHKFEKWITSQRDDRMVDDIPRGKKPQEAPVQYDGDANMQQLIDAFRKRLCYQATPEARGLAEDFKVTIRKTHPAESDVLVPNCIYRMGCPEFNECGFFRAFYIWAAKNYPDENWMGDIQVRYDLYNKYFYEHHVEE